MRKLSNIQVLRGLAALAVVMFHAREEVDGVGIATRMPGFLAGAFGVDVFFVISGLVMVYASVPLFGNARAALPFLGKRLARIVPLYWLVTLLFVAFSFGDLRATMAPVTLASFVGTSLAFVPYLAPVNEDAWPVYPLGWTLDFEMFFYLCFALVLVLPRRAAVPLLAGAFTLLVALGHGNLLPGGLAYLASSQILEFVAGMLLAQMALAEWRLPRSAAVTLVAFGVAGAFATVPYSDLWWGAWRGIVWGVPATAVVAGFALCPPAAVSASPIRRWLERLGDASYALYIVHYAFYAAVAALAGRLVHHLDRVPGPLYAAGLVAGAVLAAFAVHRGFEVPVTRALQRRAAPRQAPSLAVADP